VAHHVLVGPVQQSPQQAGAVGTGGTDALDEIHTLPARDDLRETLERLCDLELLEEAKKRQERLEKTATRSGSVPTPYGEELAGRGRARRLGMTR
jgi:hypothetical protein